MGTAEQCGTTDERCGGCRFMYSTDSCNIGKATNMDREATLRNIAE